MIIGAINHKSEEGASLLFSKVDVALKKYQEMGLKMPIDILFGPDYGLACNLKEINTSAEREELIAKSRDVSSRIPSTIFIPGSMSWNRGSEMYHSAPVFQGGNLINEFYKNTNNGEGQQARAHNFRFVPGNCDVNLFELDGKKIAYEICGDHGKQDVSGCDIELISALDNKAGFYTSVTNDSWPHFGTMTNGLDGKSLCQFYDPSSETRLEEVKTFSLTPDVSLFFLNKFDKQRK